MVACLFGLSCHLWFQPISGFDFRSGSGSGSVLVIDLADKNRTRSVCLELGFPSCKLVFPHANWFSLMQVIKGNIRNEIEGTTLCKSITHSFLLSIIQAVIHLANNGNAEFLFNGFKINHKCS